ncbi:MAG: ChaN family lipoprotein [Chthonomonadaceae bacterium]|nr:ChaN family lipoprotein [Chthonomonadaceae bacterium]
MMLPLGLALAFVMQAPSPNLLPIGTKGSVDVAPEKIVNTRTGAEVDVDAIAAAADGQRFVYVGENHDNPSHHRMQAAIIDALVRRGRDVVVGFEMFTRPVQDELNPWTLGWWSEEEFVQRSDWKNQWGFDFALYRPIFESIKKNRLPMVALNVPRDWVRAVGKEGPAGLTADQQRQVPAIDTTDKTHRSVFEAMMGGHPVSGTQGENMYAAMVLWDTGMADSALKYLDAMPPNRNRVMVVLAGSGHVMYGLGINGRVARRTGEHGVTVVMVASEAPETVSRGLGDFVYNGSVVKNAAKMPK